MGNKRRNHWSSKTFPTIANPVLNNSSSSRATGPAIQGLLSRDFSPGWRHPQLEECGTEPWVKMEQKHRECHGYDLPPLAE